MPEWSHFPRHRRQTLHLVPAVRLRPLRHKTGSHWSSLAFLQQRRKLPEQRAELASLSVLPFFPGVSRSLGTWNLPVFLLTVTCRPRLSPANHLSSSRPCSLQAPSGPPQPPQGYTPTWTNPVPGAATHPPEPVPCPGQSELSPVTSSFSICRGSVLGSRFAQVPYVNCCTYLLIS